MNNKSKQKNKSLQKGLFFAISSELEKAIGRRADWAAGAEIDDSDNEDQARAKRKKYADRFGSGEVSGKEFEEDENNPVQYRPDTGKDAQYDVRGKGELKELRTNAKLIRDQTYGTKGKEPVRESAEKRNRERFLSDKGLPPDTEITSDRSLKAADRKQYRESMEYAPKAESAEDRVWRNIRGGMTADSFTDPEDKAAYNRLSERFRDSNAGKAAIASNKAAQEAKAAGIETPTYGDPARTSSTYSYDRRDLDRIDAGKPPAADVLNRLKARAEKRAGRGSGTADTPPADPKPVDSTTADPKPVDRPPSAGDIAAKEAFEARRGRGKSPAPVVDASEGGERRAKIVTDARTADAERVRLAADEAAAEAARRTKTLSSRYSMDASGDRGVRTSEERGVEGGLRTRKDIRELKESVEKKRAERDIERTAAGKKTFADIVPDRFTRNPDGTRRVVLPRERAERRRDRYNPDFAEAAYPRARPTPPSSGTSSSSGADLGADAAKMAEDTSVKDRLTGISEKFRTRTPPRPAPRPRHDSSSAENFGQGLGAAIGTQAGGPVGGWLGAHLGKLAGRGMSRGAAVLRGERGIFRSLRNIERDANRLSKAVNKSFKKKH